MSKEQNQVEELTVKQAGVLGGTTTLAKHGREHFRVIGRKGQASLAVKITSNERRAWGMLGGRPRKRLYPSEGGEKQTNK